MAATSLEQLLHTQLQDAYSAETQLTKALPKMAQAASSKELKAGFEQHLKETEGQVRRLQQVCKQLGCDTGGETCEAMEGLIEEGEEVIDMDADADVKDAGLIIAAQKVEHYEIALYGGLCALAKEIGKPDAATILHQTLEEEKRTDEKLTHLAEQRVNARAAKK
jgi:ferritin-like metal-binding protein YciE